MSGMSHRRFPVRRGLIALIVGVFVTYIIDWLAMVLPWGPQKWYGPGAGTYLGVAQGESGDRTFEINEGRNRWHHVVTYWWMQISGLSLTLTNEYTGLPWRQLPAHLRPEALDDIVMHSWYHETGWPMPALTCAVHWETQISNSNILYRVEGGIQLPRDADFDPRALPLVPVWPGFAVSALLWGCAWWMLMWTAGAIRRFSRAKRGKCMHCGYLRTGLPAGAACPECGRA